MILLHIFSAHMMRAGRFQFICSVSEKGIPFVIWKINKESIRYFCSSHRIVQMKDVDDIVIIRFIFICFGGYKIK